MGRVYEQVIQNKVKGQQTKICFNCQGNVNQNKVTQRFCMLIL